MKRKRGLRKTIIYQIPWLYHTVETYSKKISKSTFSNKERFASKKGKKYFCFLSCFFLGLKSPNTKQYLHHITGFQCVSHLDQTEIVCNLADISIKHVSSQLLRLLCSPPSICLSFCSTETVMDTRTATAELGWISFPANGVRTLP